jgi:hypothetical protein
MVVRGEIMSRDNITVSGFIGQLAVGLQKRGVLIPSPDLKIWHAFFRILKGEERRDRPVFLKGLNFKDDGFTLASDRLERGLDLFDTYMCSRGEDSNYVSLPEDACRFLSEQELDCGMRRYVTTTVGKAERFFSGF